MWKRSEHEELDDYYRVVSEGLNSVETGIHFMVNMVRGMVSEELNSVETKSWVSLIPLVKVFQKNLIVWKPYLAIDFSYV